MIRLARAGGFGTWLALAALLCGSRCASDKQDKDKKAAPAAVDEAESKGSAVAVREQSAALAPAPAQPEVEIDPARMPVEEDFIAEAEFRIPRWGNLDKELDRIASEIKAPARK